MCRAKHEERGIIMKLGRRCHEVRDHIPYRGPILSGNHPLAVLAGTEGRGHMAICAGKKGLLQIVAETRTAQPDIRDFL